MAVPTHEQRLEIRERPSAPVVMHQGWENLLFLHWRIDPARVQTTLPPGLTVDTFEGSAWLGIIPFFVRRTRPPGLPPLPGLSSFLEMNVRTYVYDKEGRPGVWFYSLDCNHPLAVEGARRLYHLPYEHAAITAKRDSTGKIDYHWRRRRTRENTCAFAYAPIGPAAPASPDSLSFFLCERYLLFAADRKGGLHAARVHHHPYPLQDATLGAWTTRPLTLCGFGDPDREPEAVHFSSRVDVEIFPPQKL